MSDLEAALRQQCEAADALLLGRVPFEQMRAYWPLQTDDTTGITGYVNDVSKHVVSRTLQNPEWENPARPSDQSRIGSHAEVAGESVLTPTMNELSSEPRSGIDCRFAAHAATPPDWRNLAP